MRLDHVVVAAADLDAAAAAWARHGFDVQPGGTHPQWGTRNALIRFERTYIELITVQDPAAARAAGPVGSVLLDVLDRGSQTLVGYAVAVDDAAAIAHRLEAAGLAPHGPFVMSRERPDGSRLSWQLVVPGARPWLTPWPFFIAWDGPQAGGASTTRHTVGARDVTGLTVCARDPAQVADRLHELGAQTLGSTAVACPPATIRVQAGDELGLADVTVTVDDLAVAAAQAGMQEHGTPLTLAIAGVAVRLVDHAIATAADP